MTFVTVSNVTTFMTVLNDITFVTYAQSLVPKVRARGSLLRPRPEPFPSPTMAYHTSQETHSAKVDAYTRSKCPTPAAGPTTCNSLSSISSTAPTKKDVEGICPSTSPCQSAEWSFRRFCGSASAVNPLAKIKSGVFVRIYSRDSGNHVIPSRHGTMQ